MKRKICFMFINGEFKEVQRSVMNVGENGEMILIGVGSYEAAVSEAAKLAEEGIVALELCGGFGTMGHARVTEAVKGKCPVGVIRFDNHPGYGGLSGDEKWGQGN